VPHGRMNALDDFARAMASMAYPSASLEAAADDALLRDRIFAVLSDLSAKVVVLRYYSAPSGLEVFHCRTLGEQGEISLLRRAKEAAARDIARHIKKQPRKRFATSYDPRLIRHICLSWGNHWRAPRPDDWAHICKKSSFYEVKEKVEASLDQLLRAAAKEYERSIHEKEN